MTDTNEMNTYKCRKWDFVREETKTIEEAKEKLMCNYCPDNIICGGPERMRKSKKEEESVDHWIKTHKH